MKTSAAPFSLRRFTLGIFMPALCAVLSTSQAAVTAGGLVVVGYTDNNEDGGSGAPYDVIALLATENIQAGQVIYMTNNGWSSHVDNRSFSGADPTGATGKGHEQLVMLTTTGIIAAGTVIRTDASGAFTWTTSGVIDTGNIVNTDEFSHIDLLHDDASGGSYQYADQIYLFQADGVDGFYDPGENPLLHPTGFVHALHIGSSEAGAFDANYQGSNSGYGLYGTGLADGLVADLANGDPYRTVNGLDLGNSTAFELDSASHFFDGTFRINMTDSEIISLQSAGGTKEQWLALLSDSSKWTQASDLTALNTTFNFIGAAPEPSRALLLFLGLVPVSFRRRRS